MARGENSTNLELKTENFLAHTTKQMATQSPFSNKSSLIGSLMLPAAAIMGSLVAFGVFNGGLNKHSHARVEAKQVQVKKVEARKPSPLITKVEPVEVVQAVAQAQVEPLLEPKSFAEPLAEPLPEPLAEPLPEPLAEPSIMASEESNVPKTLSSEDTFEQYRQAMLHTGPRDLENQARVEMQSKGGLGNSALWRAQTASLRKSLGADDAAEFLERSNISVNDRVISSFNTYRDV